MKSNALREKEEERESKPRVAHLNCQDQFTCMDYMSNHREKSGHASASQRHLMSQTRRQTYIHFTHINTNWHIWTRYVYSTIVLIPFSSSLSWCHLSSECPLSSRLVEVNFFDDSLIKKVIWQFLQLLIFRLLWLINKLKYIPQTWNYAYHLNHQSLLYTTYTKFA